VTQLAWLPIDSVLVGSPACRSLRASPSDSSTDHWPSACWPYSTAITEPLPQVRKSAEGHSGRYTGSRPGLDASGARCPTGWSRPLSRWRPGAGVEQCPLGRFDAELPVQLFAGIRVDRVPCADSSTICARRQVTTDPLPRRTIRTSRRPSSSSISRTRRRSVTGPVSAISTRSRSALRPIARGRQEVASLTWPTFLRCRAGGMWNWARPSLPGAAWPG
jgi:hypothetical protein